MRLNNAPKTPLSEQSIVLNPDALQCLKNTTYNIAIRKSRTESENNSKYC